MGASTAVKFKKSILAALISAVLFLTAVQIIAKMWVLIYHPTVPRYDVTRILIR
jgi:hypothetical protein